MKIFNWMKIGIVILFFTMCFFAISCDEKSESPLSPELEKITKLEDFTNELEGGNMGDWVAIHGMNISDLESIYFNDVAVDLGEVYVENGVIFLQVPVQIPEDVTNQVTVGTSSGSVFLNFVVNVPDIILSHMLNEYTPPGDTIRIYGDFFKLYEVDSSSTVVDFGGKESPVIESSNNFLTARVPLDVNSNIKIRVVNKKYGVSVECPGYYKDENNMITTFDENFPYTHSTGQQFVGSWEHPKPTDGNYIRFEVDQTSYPNGLGWFYLMENSVNYELDMLQNPQDYELKFELNMANPIRKTQFFIYYYWAVAPEPIGGDFFKVQTFGQWETVAIPLDEIIPLGYDGTDTQYSLNFRVENNSPVEPVNMYFDNLRIYRKGS